MQSDLGRIESRYLGSGIQWQRRLVQLLVEGQDATASLDDIPDSYRVNAEGERGRFARDPYRDYERGRRRVPLVAAESGSWRSEAVKGLSLDDAYRLQPGDVLVTLA